MTELGHSVVSIATDPRIDAHSDIISAEETKLMHDEAHYRSSGICLSEPDILPAFDSASPVINRSRNNYSRCANLFLRPIGDRLLLDKNPR